MKNIYLASFAVLLLTACASTQSAYGPSDGSGIGFKNIQLEPDRFRVSFTARSVDEARDYALLRAAELTDGEGYTHFRIVNGGTQSNGRGSGGNTSVGVGVGTGFGGRGFRRGGGTRVNVGVGLNDVGRAFEGDKIRETIEVRLLSAAVPNDPNVYHAQSLIKSIQPPVFQ
ncbi:MAG: hypothetical protein ABJG88_09665 [Litorimonas sp.]